MPDRRFSRGMMMPEASTMAEKRDFAALSTVMVAPFQPFFGASVALAASDEEARAGAMTAAVKAAKMFLYTSPRSRRAASRACRRVKPCNSMLRRVPKAGKLKTYSLSKYPSLPKAI